MTAWIDTHCHLDAPEFAPDRDAVRARARAAGVAHCVLPAVDVATFGAVRDLAARHADSYALGIHPLHVDRADPGDLERLDEALLRCRNDPRLVAVGEIGLDFFGDAPQRERQEHFLAQQLRLAARHGLPVILHVRRSADALLKHLRGAGVGGIAHAFNGSRQQADTLIGMGFKLGFGGTMTFDGSRRIRQLAATLPLDALVLETDAPDIPPAWARGERNEPANLRRYADALAGLRGMSAADVIRATGENAKRVFGDAL